MSCSSAELEERAVGIGSSPSKKWRRRQRIEDLLASCSSEVLKFERGAAREVAASEHAIRLISERSSLLPGALLGPVAPSSASSSPARPQLRQPAYPAALTDATPGSPASLVAVLPLGHAPDAISAQFPCDAAVDHSRSRDSAASLASELLRLLAQDNTILECNIRDYDVALTLTMQEVVQLRSEVRQMGSTCSQMGQLRELLDREMRVRSQLRSENASLLDRHHCLLAGIRHAIEADDGESVSLISGLISENTALRRLLSSAFIDTADSAVGGHSPALFRGSRNVGIGAGAVSSKETSIFDGNGASATLADSTADVLDEEIHAPSLRQ